jgi:exopolyphosphatase/guanosine-5'-triphosphate,3'-diphosphate pyrophosphatase
VAIGIGGTARTLSKAIMKQSQYPLDKLHAFSYELGEHKAYLDAIALSSVKNLKNFALQKNRYDTIREGTLIFGEILTRIGTQKVISSAAGVREGVFLEQLLRDENKKFPATVNPSIVSILDRFKPLINIEKNRKTRQIIGTLLYAQLQCEIQDNKRYQNELMYALKLSNIGKTLTVYKANQHAFYIAIQELNYGFTHSQIVLISFLLRMNGRELLNKPLCDQYKPLLPEKQTVLWLSFVYSLTVLLHEASNSANITFGYDNKTLRITSDKPLNLVKEKIKALEKPIALAIIIMDESKFPKNEKLGI